MLRKKVFSLFVFFLALVFHTQAQSVVPTADDHHTEDDDHPVIQLYPGIIVIDPRQIVSVVVKINARVKNLRNLYVGQLVAHDQVLGELESAELETVQRTYLGIITNLDAVKAFSMTSNEKLIDARMSLAWRGMSEADINRLDETKEPLKLISLRAPVTGYIYSLNVVNEQIVNTGGQTGVYTTTGTTVATIANPEAVYVEMQIPLKEVVGLKHGSNAEILLPTSDGSRMIVNARVDRVFPYVNPNTQRKRVRLLFAQHPERLPLVEGLPVMVQFKDNEHAH